MGFFFLYEVEFISRCPSKYSYRLMTIVIQHSWSWDLHFTQKTILYFFFVLIMQLLYCIYSFYIYVQELCTHCATSLDSSPKNATHAHTLVSPVRNRFIDKTFNTFEGWSKYVINKIWLKMKTCMLHHNWDWSNGAKKKFTVTMH